MRLDLGGIGILEVGKAKDSLLRIPVSGDVAGKLRSELFEDSDRYQVSNWFSAYNSLAMF